MVALHLVLVAHGYWVGNLVWGTRSLVEAVSTSWSRISGGPSFRRGTGAMGTEAPRVPRTVGCLDCRGVRRSGNQRGLHPSEHVASSHPWVTSDPLGTACRATMNYQNTHAWIARGGETSDKTFAPAPHFVEHKELTTEEDKAEKRVQIKVGLLRILGQKRLGLLRIPLAVAVGFEPTVGCPTHAFETCSLGRSDTPPGVTIRPNASL